jgi:hypothetical protein
MISVACNSWHSLRAWLFLLLSAQSLRSVWDVSFIAFLLYGVLSHGWTHCLMMKNWGLVHQLLLL